MKEKFQNITFENPRHTRAFRENLHLYFEVPYSTVIDSEAVFNTQFIKVFNPAQVYAVSEQMTADGCLVYMIIKPELFKLTGAMLQMLLAEINLKDGEYLVRAHNLRVYAELQDTTGDIVHPTEQKSLKALHTGGLDGSIDWEQLVEAVLLYGVENIVLESEIPSFLEANGYNTEFELV